MIRQVAAVLKPGGALVALREPVKPLFSSRLQQARASTEKALQEGVAEPLYSKPQWTAFFDRSGLELQWHHVILSRGLRGVAARMVNGITKADFCLVATKHRWRLDRRNLS